MRRATRCVKFRGESHTPLGLITYSSFAGSTSSFYIKNCHLSPWLAHRGMSVALIASRVLIQTSLGSHSEFGPRSRKKERKKEKKKKKEKIYRRIREELLQRQPRGWWTFSCDRDAVYGRSWRCSLSLGSSIVSHVGEISDACRANIWRRLLLLAMKKFPSCPPSSFESNVKSLKRSDYVLAFLRVVRATVLWTT